MNISRATSREARPLQACTLAFRSCSLLIYSLAIAISIHV